MRPRTKEVEGTAFCCCCGSFLTSGKKNYENKVICRKCHKHFLVIYEDGLMTVRELGKEDSGILRP